MTASRRARLFHSVSSEEHGMRLDLLVGAWLARELARPLSKSVVRTLIMAGAVRSDGRPVRRPGWSVTAGTRLETTIDVARLDRTGRASSARTDLDRTAAPDVAVLYEDEHLIAVAKPAGLLTHAAADRTRADLFNAVRTLLAGRGEGSSAQPLPYLGLHHRLDLETSGVVLFTRRDEANSDLAAQFARGQVEKVYHAIVGRPSRDVPDRWRVENRLAPGGSGRRSRVGPAANGLRAATDFTVLEFFPAALLVEARPETGRKHQIRAHLAEARMPILGDTRYGGASRAAGCAARRMMLHACSLSLRHPITGAPLTIECPYPADFAGLLGCLRRA